MIESRPAELYADPESVERVGPRRVAWRMLSGEAREFDFPSDAGFERYWSQLERARAR